MLLNLGYAPANLVPRVSRLTAWEGEDPGNEVALRLDRPLGSYANAELIFLPTWQEPKEEGEEGEDENEDEEEKDKKVNQEFLVCAFDCLGQSWPKNATDSQGELLQLNISNTSQTFAANVMLNVSIVWATTLHLSWEDSFLVQARFRSKMTCPRKSPESELGKDLLLKMPCSVFVSLLNR